MSYLVLARKYRPRTFDEIVGQQHVTVTLCNAIRMGRVHHAFLFTGARGVGKTSAARILAKALNCAQGPTAQPCGQCDPCREIATASAVDVFEIDGASNRGIAEIRELRDGIGYSPSRDRYKIYIIDEVHMLTPEAFNALLKTLEEPPAHAIFIFATTEPHKIPLTILSRCQRFDFKRIAIGQVIERLQAILTAEGLQIEPAGLRQIAREGEGSMRDAVSLLDQVIAFAGSHATTQQVVEILGVADRRWLQDLLKALLERDTPTALHVVEQADHYGVSIGKFAEELLQLLRDMLVLKVCGGDAGLTDLAEEESRDLMELGAGAALEDLQRLFSVLLQATVEIATSTHPRMILESALIKMAHLRQLVPLQNLIMRMARIEQSFATGRLQDLPPMHIPVVEHVAPVSRNESRRPSEAITPPAAFVGPAQIRLSSGATPSLASAVPSAKTPPGFVDVVPNTRALPDVVPPALPVPPAADPTEQMEQIKDDAEPTVMVRPPPIADSSITPSDPTSAVLQQPSGPAAWDSFVHWARGQNRHRFLLESFSHAIVQQFTADHLHLAFTGERLFLAQRMRERDQSEKLATLLQEYFGVAPSIQISEIAAETSVASESLAVREEKVRRERQCQREKVLTSHPAVQDVIDFFGGKLLEVRFSQDALAET